MKYQLAIFDMDGTLVEEFIDFAAIRRDIGLSAEKGIIEGIAELAADKQARAYEILHQHELAAANACALHDGAAGVLETLRERGVKTAILTRNSAACVGRILERHALVLDYAASRDDLPHKPHPDSILNIVRRFGVTARATLMVGDYLYDLQAANAAGVDSALFCAEREWPEFAALATYRIRHLRDLLGIVEPVARETRFKI